jgi:drug/metabolite transporter (DMT)-like permease
MDRHLLPGLGAVLAAALIGAGWQIASRQGVTTTLGPLEIAILRYGVPALLLAPVLRRLGLKPDNVAWPVLALLVLGGGLPFGLLALAGVQFAPAAHMGVFMAGCVPLFTALLGWFFGGEAVRGWRWLGLGLVAGGVAVLGGSAWAGGASSAWRGDLLFLVAAAAWAGYTLAFRRSGLTPWQGAALVNAWSALLLVPLVLVFGAPKLATAPVRDLLFQLLWQGLLAGVLGLVAYTAAVARLGPARASLSGALVPPLTAAGAALLLGEALTPLTAASAVAVALGIVLGLKR